MVPEVLQISGLSLPVREDDLWPPGQLLQLVGIRLGFKGGPVKGAGYYVIILTKSSLVIKGARVRELESDDEEIPPNYLKEGVEFYKPGCEYYVRDFVGEYSCPSSDLCRVVFDHYGLGSKLRVWAQDGNQRVSRVIGMIVLDPLPRTIMSLANKAADVGLVKRGTNLGLRWTWHAWPLFRKEIERRFKQATPSATVLVKGRILDDETFRRLVR